jgi:hypothetical protein
MPWTSQYLVDLNTAMATRDRLANDQTHIRVRSDAVQGEQRSLIDQWEAERLRLGYFDFLYFSTGVAAFNTFGDIIPNRRAVGL